MIANNQKDLSADIFISGRLVMILKFSDDCNWRLIHLRKYLTRLTGKENLRYISNDTDRDEEKKIFDLLQGKKKIEFKYREVYNGA